MRFVTPILLVVSAACSKAAPTSSTGVGPNSDPAPAVIPKSSIDLVEPIEPAPATTAEPTPVVVKAAPKIQFEIDPLGRFEVITWEEALRRAESKFTAQTAESSLRALRQDILGRRR